MIGGKTAELGLRAGSVARTWYPVRHLTGSSCGERWELEGLKRQKGGGGGATLGWGLDGVPGSGLGLGAVQIGESEPTLMAPSPQPPSPCSLTPMALHLRRANPERGTERDATVSQRSASHRIAPRRNTEDAPVAGLAGRAGPKQDTRKALEHWQGRTGSQNSASTPESGRPTSSFGRQAPRIVLASGRLPATNHKALTRLHLRSLCLNSSPPLLGRPVLDPSRPVPL